MSSNFNSSVLCLCGIFSFCLHVMWSWIFLFRVTLVHYELIFFFQFLWVWFHTTTTIFLCFLGYISEFFRLYMFAYPLCVTSNSGFRFDLTTKLIGQDRPHLEVNVFTFKKGYRRENSCTWLVQQQHSRNLIYSRQNLRMSRHLTLSMFMLRSIARWGKTTSVKLL